MSSNNSSKGSIDRQLSRNSLMLLVSTPRRNPAAFSSCTSATIGSLAKYNIAYSESEETPSLVNKLAQFYADRTLTKSPITPADQAEAYFLLVGNRLSKTTGQVIAVDGGLHEAFLR